jgi:tRNA threonylcarbamoyladenosine biosynthesis protein TsaE
LGLGVLSLIHSPTFALIHEHVGRMPVYHFDLYRLSSPDEMEDLGCESYLYGQGVTIIEWAERAEELLRHDRIEIHVSGEGEERILQVCGTGPRAASALERL